jgi:hypothetical protein
MMHHINSSILPLVGIWYLTVEIMVNNAAMNILEHVLC